MSPALWMKEYDTPTRLSTMGIAFVLPSAMMRGMLTAILWLQPMSCPHHVTATLSDGVLWARAQLRQAAGRSLPPGGASTRL